MGERLVEANGVTLCCQAFGDPADPAILLIMGAGASMLWWDERLCQGLAGAGRFVIRYDQRDTGRSVSYEPGRPPYDGGDLVGDAAGVLDAFGVAAAHIVGVSAGGALAQLLALDHPDRVRSLVLISTSPATPGDRGLPPPTEQLRRVAGATVDWSDSESVIDHTVTYARVLNGGTRPFDEAAWRAFVRRDVERTRSVAALQNHGELSGDERERAPLSSVSVPTLVIHGSADPVFPLEHGRSLAGEIPGATLLTLDGAGHGIDRADGEILVAAIVEHTRRSG